MNTFALDFKNLSIRRKQVVIIMLTSSVALLLACAAFVAYDVTSFRKALIGETSTTADIIGNSCTAALDFNDPKAAEEALAVLRVKQGIIAACIYDRQGNMFANYKRDGSNASAQLPPVNDVDGHEFVEGELHMFKPIVIQGETVGVIYLAQDLKQLHQLVSRGIGIIALVLLFSLLIAFIVSSRLQRFISDPISNLAKITRSVAVDKNYSVRVEKSSGAGQDELGQLIDGFNEMLAQIQMRDIELQASRDMLEKRVNERTAKLAESLSLLNATLESTADGILVVNPQGCIASYNTKFGEMWRLPRELIESGNDEEMIKCVVGQLKDEEGFIRRVSELYANPEMEGRDILEFKDGRVFERFTQPQRLGDSIVGRVWCFRDVTERMRAENAVRESQALYHSLVDQMPAGVFRKNREGRFVFVNSWFCQLKNMEPDQILGRTASEIASAQIQNPTAKWVPFLADQGSAHHEKIMRTGETIELEEQYSDLTGKMQFLRAVKSPVFDSDGKIAGSQGILFNITENKQAEAALQQERNLLRTLIDHIPDYIYVRDRSNRFVVANESFARLMGVAGPSALIGKQDADFYPPEMAANFDQIDREVFAGHPFFNRERNIRFPNGQELTILNSKVPFKNAKGEVIGLIGIGRDITKRKRVEAELDYERNLLRMMLENSPDVIYFKDTQSRFVKASKALAIKFGLGSPDEMAGHTDFDFFSKEHARPAFEDEQEILRTGRPLIGKVEKEITKDGRVSWALTNKMPLRDKDGHIFGTFGITKDITAMKDAEAKLEEMHKRLLETSRQAGMAEIATNVLHNVGNVLNSVNVSASLVTDGIRKSKVSSLAKVVELLSKHEHDLGAFFTSDPRGNQLPDYLSKLSDHFLEQQKTAIKELESLRANIEHIKEIVAMQQTYARVSGVMEFVDIRDLVEDSLRMNLGALARHGVEIVREFDDVTTVNTDKHKVLQILVNLLRNAKHACQESENAEKRLTVRVANGKGRIKISVTDNGVGISPENLERIFNHGFTTRKDGHGFGLHSGALAAKELGGALTVFSEGVGKGATFTLELPANRNNTPDS